MTITPPIPRLRLGPYSAGLPLTPEEFDSALDQRGWRYELIHGMLIVSPTPRKMERDPNEELGRLLRNYQDDHSQGSPLDATLPEEVVRFPLHRRRPDRVIWAGLG